MQSVNINRIQASIEIAKTSLDFLRSGGHVTYCEAKIPRRIKKKISVAEKFEPLIRPKSV